MGSQQCEVPFWRFLFYYLYLGGRSVLADLSASPATCSGSWWIGEGGSRRRIAGSAWLSPSWPPIPLAPQVRHLPGLRPGRVLGSYPGGTRVQRPVVPDGDPAGALYLRYGAHWRARGLRLRQRPGYRAVPLRRGGAGIRPAERPPVPGRRSRRHDHPAARCDHGRVHRLPGGRPIRCRRDGLRGLPARVPVRGDPEPLVQAPPGPAPVERLPGPRHGGGHRGIAGAAFVLGRRAIFDIPTSVIALLTLAIVWRWKVPEPFLIAAAGLAGLLLFRA